MLDFLKDYQWDGRDWIILGKGPSLDRLTLTSTTGYNTLSLNHACRNHPVGLAHIIDLDVIDSLGSKLLTQCWNVVIPYYPHMGWRPHPHLTLDDISKKNKYLSILREEGRLYGYNLSTAAQMINKRWNDSPLVWASFFSAEAAVSLLGNLGVKRIRTIGVDGGKGQASAFTDLQNINTNGYDAQWQGIRKSIKKFALDYAPLGADSPIRIFIGAGDAQLIPALVLKHSIEKHATSSTSITIMNEWTHPMPKDARNQPRTPFSFQRFMIPEKCGYEGHAIYMDSDMLVFGDVREIWDFDGPGLVVMRHRDTDKHKAQYSVFRIDCELLNWNLNEIVDNLDSGKLTYENLVFNLITASSNSGVYIEQSGFNPDWNSLEEYTEGKTKLLHYTEMYNQPWLANPNHPLGHLWFSELKEAVADGSIDKKLIEEHVARRWILPKCLEVL